MIAKELILKSDVKKIWEYLYDDYFKHRDYPKDKIEYFRRSISKTVKIMRDIEPIIDNDWLVVISQFYDDLELSSEIYIGSDLYKKSEIKEKFKIDSIIEENMPVESWKENDFMTYFKDVRPYITVWGFEFTDWNEVLGFDIWDGSIIEFGLERCAAAVLYEMTYCGFTPEQVKEKADKIFGDSEKIHNDTVDEAEADEEDIEKLHEEFNAAPENNYDLTESLRVSYKNWTMQYPRLKKIYNELMEGDKNVCDNGL